MKKLSLTLAAVAIAAAGVHANWLLSTYSTVTPDSASTNKLYGYQSYSNPASAVTVSVPGGYVELKATKIASTETIPSNDGYTANIGLLHPLTPDWAPHDLRGLDSITFEFRNTNAITDPVNGLQLSFGSLAYSTIISNSGWVYLASVTGTANLAAGTTWKKATVKLADFGPPTSWAPSWEVTLLPTIDSVLSQVKNIQFAPTTLYTAAGNQNALPCTKCTSPSMTAQTLDIRNVILYPVNIYTDPNPANLGCSDLNVSEFADFAAGTNVNNVGGYFYNFSDFDSTKTATDKAKGSSSSAITYTPGDALNPGTAVLTAGLNKMDAGVWHDYAGWAAIGSGFKNSGTANLTGLTAIQFTIGGTGAVLGPNVQSVLFKVTQHGVSDTATHYVDLPAASVVAGKTYCIRPSDLHQASFVTTPTTIDFSKIDKLAWEAIITDNKNPAIIKDTASFLLSDVKFYGVTDGYTVTSGIVPRKLAGSSFSAAYDKGFLNIQGLSGIKNFDVFTLNGTKVASFAPNAHVALSLTHGTYFLAGQQNNSRLVKQFAVIGQ